MLYLFMSSAALIAYSCHTGNYRISSLGFQRVMFLLFNDRIDDRTGSVVFVTERSLIYVTSDSRAPPM